MHVPTEVRQTKVRILDEPGRPDPLDSLVNVPMLTRNVVLGELAFEVLMS